MKDDFAEFTGKVRSQVDRLGFELVDLRRGGSRRRPRLQARIDRPNSEPGHGVTVDDCAVVSRALQRWLDDDDILGLEYVLEVSSPGIERPIRWAEHWRRFCGRDVNVKLATLGRIRATIVDVVDDGGTVVLRLRDNVETVSVPIGEARDATLVVDWT